MEKVWKKWKLIYKAAQGRECVRSKAGGGKNSFGGVNASGANTVAAATNSPPTDASGAETFTIDEVEACFDNLTNAAKAERSTLD